jgi:hypothetical protein
MRLFEMVAPKRYKVGAEVYFRKPGMSYIDYGDVVKDIGNGYLIASATQSGGPIKVADKHMVSEEDHAEYIASVNSPKPEKKSKGTPGAQGKEKLTIEIVSANKANKEWIKLYGKADRNPFSGDKDNLTIIAKHGIKMVAAADVMIDNETIEGVEGAFINDIRSHLTGGAKAIIDYLKANYSYVEGEAETEAGAKMFVKTGFKKSHEGGVGFVYAWFKDRKSERAYKQSMQ